jgi:hypothetical protein
MHPFTRAIVLTAVVAAAPVPAETPVGRDVKTMRHLIELCSLSADDPSYAAAMGFCLGYIDAALDYNAAITSGARFAPVFCPGTSVSREEVVSLFQEWSEADSPKLDSESPVEGVMRALYEKCPCDKDKPGRPSDGPQEETP